jgi:hypothetical protein
MATSRADTVARRNTELGRVAAEHFRFDAGDGGRDFQENVPPLQGNDVRNQRVSIERRVVPFEGNEAA